MHPLHRWLTPPGALLTAIAMPIMRPPLLLLLLLLVCVALPEPARDVPPARPLWSAAQTAPPALSNATAPRARPLARPGTGPLQPAPPLELFVRYARRLVQSGAYAPGPDPGPEPLWRRGLRGEGQVVGVADGRLNLRSCFLADPACPVPRSPTCHRKLTSYARAAARAGAPLPDLLHGTHTASVIAGDPAGPWGGDPALAPWRGVAPAARLAYAELEGVPADVGAVFDAARRAGARVHCNAWGGYSYATALAEEQVCAGRRARRGRWGVPGLWTGRQGTNARGRPSGARLRRWFGGPQCGPPGRIHGRGSLRHVVLALHVPVPVPPIPPEVQRYPALLLQVGPCEVGGKQNCTAQCTWHHAMMQQADVCP